MPNVMSMGMNKDWWVVDVFMLLRGHRIDWTNVSHSESVLLIPPSATKADQLTDGPWWIVCPTIKMT